MTKNPTLTYSSRPVVIHDLPLPGNTRLLRPEAAMIRLANSVHDIGSFCYTLRSNKKRKPEGSGEVVLDSFRKERIPQVHALIETLSSLLVNGGLRPATLISYCNSFKDFMRWADTNGQFDCLEGGETTRRAYRSYASDVDERFRRHEFGSAQGSQYQSLVLTVLEALTGLDDLATGIRSIRYNPREMSGTEPATEHDFAHALAVNHALFHGLSNLVLENQPFPFKLPLPESLGWEESHLWVFPVTQWFRPPHELESSSTLTTRVNVFDYKNGQLAVEDDIWPFYMGRSERTQRWWARFGLAKAGATLDAANSDSRAYYRLMLASLACDAFFFQFLANTGANLQTAIDIETDGALNEGAANQGYRSTKWRAGGKEVDLVVPVAFLPTLRRYLELRKFLLNGVSCSHLFFSLGRKRLDVPIKVSSGVVSRVYVVLRRIDPAMPLITARKIRATVSNYYQQQHDAAVTAAVLQNTEAITLRNYNAGTESDQRVEMSLVLRKLAQKAKTEVVAADAPTENARPLEDGGVCQSYGHPQALSADSPSKPDCKTGCLFCAKRILVAGEEDTRKVASAAYLMKRLIAGPLSELEYRPQIAKCDEDLAMLRAFEGCADMVDRVIEDVFESGNLTPYFADKYQLFLSLGVL